MRGTPAKHANDGGVEDIFEISDEANFMNDRFSGYSGNTDSWMT